MKKPSFFNQESLVDDLWREMTTTGFANRSKTDFYDLVLYLLNKYDKNHFLNTNDNAENERLLKTKDTRIKEAKKNILVQFMDESEYDNIFYEFIVKIGSGDLPSLDDTGEAYTMVIEDRALRSILETKLKRVANTTLDYKMNTELVTISHEAFLKMLASELEFKDEGRDGIIKLVANVIDSLKDVKSKQTIKKGLEEAVDTLKESDSLQSFGINAIKAIAAYATTKFLAKAESK